MSIGHCNYIYYSLQFSTIRIRAGKHWKRLANTKSVECLFPAHGWYIQYNLITPTFDLEVDYMQFPPTKVVMLLRSLSEELQMIPIKWNVGLILSVMANLGQLQIIYNAVCWRYSDICRVTVCYWSTIIR